MDEGADSLMADTLITGTTLVEKESRSIGDAPIGAILAWAKSLAGVPNLAEGWVECDGSVLVDYQSSLNGQTIPDLNGDNRFMRGDTTSGGTGGSESHRHINKNFASDGANTWTTSIGENGAPYQAVTQKIDVTAVGATTENYVQTETTSTLPTYYGVVWIIRVR